MQRCDLTGDRWLDDVQVGAWIELDKGKELPPRVTALVPSPFQAFARVFHPLKVGLEWPVRWREAAVRNGRSMHATVQLHEVLLREGEHATASELLRGQGVGSLPADEFRALWDALRAHTTADTLYLGYWEGFGVEEFSGPRPLLEVAGAGVRHVLAAIPAGALEEAHLLNEGFGPNLVWPADRAWLCHTDVDGLSTYVGGTAAAIDAVLRHPGLEALAVQPNDPAYY